jgi:excisionase family DNA binding protein
MKRQAKSKTTKKPIAKKPAPKPAKAKRVLGNKAKAKTPTTYPKPDALPPLDPNRLLKPQEAADRMTVSLSTLRRLIKAGRLPVVRVGHAIRIRPADLEDFLTSTSATPTN